MELHLNKAIQVLKTFRLPELNLGAMVKMGFSKQIPKAVPFTASPCKHLHYGQKSFCVLEIYEREVLSLSLNLRGTPTGKGSLSMSEKTDNIDLFIKHSSLHSKPLSAPSYYFWVWSNDSDRKYTSSVVSRTIFSFCLAEWNIIADYQSYCSFHLCLLLA